MTSILRLKYLAPWIAQAGGGVTAPMSLMCLTRPPNRVTMTGCPEFATVVLPAAGRRLKQDQARLDPNLAPMQPGIEPLVRFFEETPRCRLIEETAVRIRGGLPYRNLLAALLVAGAIRDLQATILHLLGLDPSSSAISFRASTTD